MLNYFDQLPGSFYDVDADVRLVDDTEATEFFNVTNVITNCQPQEYFSDQLQLCIPCADFSLVSFSEASVDFLYQLGSETNFSSQQPNTTSPGSAPAAGNKLAGIIVLSNQAGENFVAVPWSLPSWLEIRLTGNSSVVAVDRNYILPARSSPALHLWVVVPEPMPAGTAVRTVSVGYSQYPLRKVRLGPGNAIAIAEISRSMFT